MPERVWVDLAVVEDEGLWVRAVPLVLAGKPPGLLLVVERWAAVAALVVVVVVRGGRVVVM